MPGDRARCPRCGKAMFRKWGEAQRECRLIRRHNKRLRTLRVYWSRRCQCFHLGRATNHHKTRLQQRKVKR